MIDLAITPEIAASGARVYMERVNRALANGYTPLKEDIESMRRYADMAGKEVVMTHIYYKFKNKPTYLEFKSKGRK